MPCVPSPLLLAGSHFYLEGGNFFCAGPRVCSAQPVPDEEALGPLVNTLLDVELLTQRITQAFGGTAICSDRLGHLVQRQAGGGLCERMNECKRAAKLAHPGLRYSFNHAHRPTPGSHLHRLQPLIAG